MVKGVLCSQDSVWPRTIISMLCAGSTLLTAAGKHYYTEATATLVCFCFKMHDFCYILA